MSGLKGNKLSLAYNTSKAVLSMLYWTTPMKLPPKFDATWEMSRTSARGGEILKDNISSSHYNLSQSKMESSLT